MRALFLLFGVTLTLWGCKAAPDHESSRLFAAESSLIDFGVCGDLQVVGEGPVADDAYRIVFVTRCKLEPRPDDPIRRYVAVHVSRSEGDWIPVRAELVTGAARTRLEATVNPTELPERTWVDRMLLLAIGVPALLVLAAGAAWILAGGWSAFGRGTRWYRFSRRTATPHQTKSHESVVSVDADNHDERSV